MADLPARVLDAIGEHRLLIPGEAVVVAVSGGCDSMVLLDVLCRLAGDTGWRLTVAHFNHGLRGHASDLDEAWVVRAARRRGLPVVTERGNVRAHARDRGVSLEMAARELRHRFLVAVARSADAGKIALAHHADDQVETFFLRVLRGTGGEGLAGMKWQSPSPADPSRWLIRPLLGETRASLLAHARARRVSFREDSSNRLWDTPRNALRRRVLPWLRRYVQPALELTVPRLMTLVGDEADLVAGLARDWLKGRTSDAFGKLHPALQRRVLHLQLRELGVEPGFELVEHLRRAPGVPMVAPGGLRLWREPSGRVRSGAAPALEFVHRSRELVLEGPGRCEFGGLRLTWTFRRRRPGRPPRVLAQPGRECLDADGVGARVVLRHWQAGDRFQPLGLDRPAKLQDLFTNARAPAAERRRRVLATRDDGLIFWVEGLRPGHTVRVTAATRRVLEWRWERVEHTGEAPSATPVAPPEGAW